MSITATGDGGRLITGDTNLAAFRFDVSRSASGKRLRLVDEDGVDHGAATIDIRDIPPRELEAIERAAGHRGCRGCGDR